MLLSAEGFSLKGQIDLAAKPIIRYPPRQSKRTSHRHLTKHDPTLSPTQPLRSSRAPTPRRYPVTSPLMRISPPRVASSIERDRAPAVALPGLSHSSRTRTSAWVNIGAAGRIVALPCARACEDVGLGDPGVREREREGAREETPRCHGGGARPRRVSTVWFPWFLPPVYNPGRPSTPLVPPGMAVPQFRTWLTIAAAAGSHGEARSVKRGEYWLLRPPGLVGERRTRTHCGVKVTADDASVIRFRLRYDLLGTAACIMLVVLINVDLSERFIIRRRTTCCYRASAVIIAAWCSRDLCGICGRSFLSFRFPCTRCLLCFTGTTRVL